MSGALRPIALTCGEPAGIGAEIAVLARTALPDLPFFWLGDPPFGARDPVCRNLNP